MNVQLVLNQPPSGKFTNLDLVTGSVILRVPRPTNISHITVKLEGESMTRIEDPDWGNQRGITKEEAHRLLYKVEKVFPPANMPPRGGPGFLITPGVYEYPFCFKLPFNNSCLTNPAPATGSFVLALNHVKKTLPPSMHIGLTATIRYFVKVTVNVPSLFKENPRAFSYFNFDPIEPPRPSGSGEAYARRTQQFQESQNNPRRSSTSFSTLFKSSKSQSNVSLNGSSSTDAPSLPPAKLTVDFRLPNPAILTCGADIPIRLLLRNLTTRTKPVYLQSLQIELVGFTKIRAQEVEKVETQHWVILSKNNMYRTIGDPSDAIDTETEIAPDLLSEIKVPDSACAEFVTCNVGRWYELHASVGLSYGTKTPGQDQFVVLPLKHQVSIYSGIAPPPELLERLTQLAQQPGGLNHVDSDLANSPISPTRPRPPVAVASSSSSAPSQPSSSSSRPPAQPGPYGQNGPAPPSYDEPPPSYEDTMAENLRPADGIRPGYRPPDPSTGIDGGGHGIWRDEKP